MALGSVGGGHQNLIGIIEYEETPQKYRIPAVRGLIGASSYWTQEIGENVIGDAAAIGTSILTITIPQYYHCVGVVALGWCNLAGALLVGLGALAAPPTTYYFIDIPNRGAFGGMAEGTTPLFVIPKSTTAAQTITVYAPQTAWGVAATNNDILHYYYGFLGVLMFKDPTSHN